MNTSTAAPTRTQAECEHLSVGTVRGLLASALAALERGPTPVAGAPAQSDAGLKLAMQITIGALGRVDDDTLIGATHQAPAKADAWVPVHPRSGALWTMTTPEPSSERLPASYPLRPLVFADRGTPPSIIEQIAQQWDGCVYEAVGEDIDVGAAIRQAARRLQPSEPTRG